MFENLLKTLHGLSETSAISVPLSTDCKGYIDKECPKEGCLFYFKVKEEDWTAIGSGAMVTCPMCGHKAHTESWYTTDQINEAKGQAVASFQGALNRAMREDAQAFNSRQSRNSLVKMSMIVSGASTSHSTIIVPLEAAEAMELEIACEQCATRFAVVGSAFFCPTCGHNSAERMFDDALRKLEVKISSTEIVREAIERASGKDAGAIAAKSMLESCLPDGVVAFQKLAEALYMKLLGVRPASTNVFQRLADGSDLWKRAVGYSYEDWLLPNELSRLRILFQQRHLLAHSEGIVDAKYLSNTNDPNYREGQRIVVVKQDVEDLKRILAKLAQAMRAAAAK